MVERRECFIRHVFSVWLCLDRWRECLSCFEGMSLLLVRCVLIARMLRLCGTVILLQRAEESNIVFLAIADCINISIPLLAQTRHLINKKMKDGVRIVNTARGQVVDEDTIVEGLKVGKIFSAGLDVHCSEPKVHPALREMENVIIPPHMGGMAIETHSGFERL